MGVAEASRQQPALSMQKPKPTLTASAGSRTRKPSRPSTRTATRTKSTRSTTIRTNGTWSQWAVPPAGVAVFEIHEIEPRRWFMSSKHSALFLLGLLFALAAPLSASPVRGTSSPMVPAGTPLEGRMVYGLGSAPAHPADTFYGTLETPPADN